MFIIKVLFMTAGFYWVNDMSDKSRILNTKNVFSKRSMFS